MTVLVLCIDRDNDFGVKAGVASPLVGRAANVEGALALSLADPEDSDANSVYGAVHIYDDLVKQGVKAEVVTLCGSPRVGPASDRIIANQLDRLLAGGAYESCIFVTDGAEDEFLLPLVTSRIPVEAVRRIIVKQHADMESTYYVIKKALEDDKLQRSLLLPFALACMVFGVFALLGQVGIGLGAIFVTIGVSFLFKVLHVGPALRRVWNFFYLGITTGRITLYTILAGLLLAAVGAVFAGRALWEVRHTYNVTILALFFVRDFSWWAVGSVLLMVSGKLVDAYLREGVILWSYWMMPFSLVSIGLLLHSGAQLLAGLILEGTIAPNAWDAAQIALGLLLLGIGTVSYPYVKQHMSRYEHRGPAKKVPAEEPGVSP